MNRRTTVTIVMMLSIIATLVVSPGTVSAQSESDRFKPPEPNPQERDWIKLNSGEWLWGDIKGLRDKDLKFDSEELDVLELDWDDVAEVRSARILTYRFDDIGRFSGTALMRDDVVKIKVGEEVKELPRANLLAILEGRPTELNFWSAKISLGWVGRAGNTEQVDLNSLLDVRRVTTRTRFLNRYTGNIGEVDGEQNINSHNFNTSFDYLVAAGFFVTPASWNYFRDPFTNIKYRNTIGAGAGYAILRGGDVDWDLGLSVGYQMTQFESVQEGEDDSESTTSIIPNTSIEWDLTDDLEFGFIYNSQISVPEVKNTVHHGEWILSVEIWNDNIDFDISFIWDRNENPREDAEGNVPKRDDFRTAFGFGLEI